MEGGWDAGVEMVIDVLTDPCGPSLYVHLPVSPLLYTHEK